MSPVHASRALKCEETDLRQADVKARVATPKAAGKAVCTLEDDERDEVVKMLLVPGGCVDAEAEDVDEVVEGKN